MTWRKRLGGYLMVRREQEKHWNRSLAARLATLDRKTIVSIEMGGNVEVENLERYASTLGRELEWCLRDVLLSSADTWDGKTERRTGIERRKGFDDSPIRRRPLRVVPRSKRMRQ